MQVDINDITIFSKCPKFFWFMRNSISTPEPKKLYIIKNTISKVYSLTLETERLVNWRKIVGFVDNLVFKDVDVTNDDAFKAAHTLAQGILGFLRRWYDIVYTSENTLGYPQMKLEAMAGIHTVTGTVPLIKIKDTPTIMYIDDNSQPYAKIYNDIKARGWAWLVSDALTSSKINLQRLAIKKVEGMSIDIVTIDEKANDRAGRMCAHIAELISKDVDYPVVTEQCINCAFRIRCKL